MRDKRKYFRGLASLLVAAALANAVHGNVAWPSGTQDFESMNVGDNVATLPLWVTVNAGVDFTVIAANDVLGTPTTRGSSTRWLRSTDTDAVNSNRFYSTTITAPVDPESYTWTYFVNLETTPPSSPSQASRIVVQHDDGGFQNFWGIEFGDTGAFLVVTSFGGTPASAALYPLTGATAVGEWVKLDFSIDFTSNTASAAFNDGLPVSLPINMSPTADKKVLRFCYRGDGTGNVQTLLVDDVSFSGVASSAVSDWQLFAN